MNATVIGEKHIRVDLEEGEHDYEKTIFIGNLPWVVNEEEVR